MQERGPANARFSAPWALLAVVAVLVFVAFVRLRLADTPLERDEGEYAYAGQLILQGTPPYALVYNMKFPGTYYAYAGILAIFGHTPWGIHVGLLLVNAVTILLVFPIGRRLLGEFGGGAAAVTFAILSVDRWVLGVFAHATHFVALAVLGGLLMLLRANEDERTSSFVWSGVFFGLSVLMKQHAIFFLPLAAALVLFGDAPENDRALGVRASRIGMLALGVLIPLAVVVIVLMAHGVLGRFWFWTFRYAREYVSETPVSLALSNFGTGVAAVTTASRAIWIVAGIGLVALWAEPWEARTRACVTGLLVASFLASCPGFYFRPHYFIPVLPAVALLCGVAVASVRRLVERTRARRMAGVLAVALLVAAIGLYAAKEHDFLLSMDTRTLSRVSYGGNPFVEAVEIGRYVRDHSDPNDRIAVMGSEPEIYFYADRKSATGYVYTYPLVELQQFAQTMQEEMIREIETAHPRFVVFVVVDTSWQAAPGSDQGIVTWGRKYVRQCYDPVGAADIISKDETRMVWGEDIRGYVAISPRLVYTFLRKSDAPCVVGN